MEWLIYKHTSPSGKVYIGQTKQDVNSRWQNGNGYLHNVYFYNAIKKYGWSNFQHEIIERNIKTQANANNREIYWISYFDSFNNGYNLTKGGDNHDHLGIPVLQIDKKSLEILNSFLTLRHAEESTGIDHSLISKCCYNDKKNVSAGNYFWCFQDEWTENWKPKTKKIPKIPKKAVFCIDKYFKIIGKYQSCLEAETATGVPCGRISQVCNHKNYITAGGYHWCFIEEWTENWKPTLPKDEKPVVRISKNNFKDIKIYPMITLAAIDNNIKNSELISRACKRDIISTGGYYWCYLSEYDEKWEPRKDNNKSKIICIETGIIYNSISEAIEKTNGSPNISKACRDSGLTSGGYHWMYYEEYRNKGWIPRNKRNDNKKKVCCIETNETFESVSSASRNKNVDSSEIIKCCKNPSKKTKGLHWKYLEDKKD